MNTYSFKNRELSWLDFNERVLQEAEDICVPLIEKKMIDLYDLTACKK